MAKNFFGKVMERMQEDYVGAPDQETTEVKRKGNEVGLGPNPGPREAAAYCRAVHDQETSQPKNKPILGTPSTSTDKTTGTALDEVSEQEFNLMLTGGRFARFVKSELLENPDFARDIIKFIADNELAEIAKPREFATFWQTTDERLWKTQDEAFDMETGSVLSIKPMVYVIDENGYPLEPATIEEANQHLRAERQKAKQGQAPAEPTPKPDKKSDSKEPTV